MATQIDLGAVVPIGKGDWNEGTTYERANIVRHNSVAWICKVDSSIGVEPTEDSSDWYLLVKDTSSVTSVNGQRGDVNLDIPSIMVGATDEINGTSGLVPKPTAGDQNKVLHGDGTWKSVAGKHIGEIFMYTGTDIPSGSLRLDGQSIVSVTTAFPDFKVWAIDNGNVVTCTLTEYEAELSQYEDQCGKFGWDQATDTLRLPKVSHFVGAALTVDDISKAVKAGLPNITSNAIRFNRLMDASDASELGWQGALNVGTHLEAVDSAVSITTQAGTNVYSGIGFDASKSSPIYGNSSTVTPAHVKFPYFIHVYDSVVEASEAQASEFVGLVDGLRQDVPELATNACLPLSGGIMTGRIQWKNAGGNTSIGFIPNEGAFINLFRRDDPSNFGGFTVCASDETNLKYILGLTNGILRWDNKNIVRSVNNINADDYGNVNINNSIINPSAFHVDSNMSGNFNGITLPSGGTWRYAGVYQKNTSTYFSVSFSGDAAGGTTLDISGKYYLLIAVRIA